MTRSLSRDVSQFASKLEAATKDQPHLSMERRCTSGVTTSGDLEVSPGFAKVWNRVLDDRSLSIGARLLFARLCGWRPEPDDSILATHEQLGACLGAHPNTVARWRDELGREGLIEWEAGRTGRPTRYRLADPVVRRDQRGDGILEVAAQPQPELLDAGCVLEAEALDVAGVGCATAAPDLARRASGIPTSGAVGRVEVGSARHHVEGTAASGVRRAGR
jgi:hypothetical protein